MDTCEVCDHELSVTHGDCLVLKCDNCKYYLESDRGRTLTVIDGEKFVTYTHQSQRQKEEVYLRIQEAIRKKKKKDWSSKGF